MAARILSTVQVAEHPEEYSDLPINQTIQALLRSNVAAKICEPHHYRAMKVEMNLNLDTPSSIPDSPSGAWLQLFQNWISEHPMQADVPNLCRIFKRRKLNDFALQLENTVRSGSIAQPLNLSPPEDTYLHSTTAFLPEVTYKHGASSTANSKPRLTKLNRYKIKERRFYARPIIKTNIRSLLLFAIVSEIVVGLVAYHYYVSFKEPTSILIGEGSSENKVQSVLINTTHRESILNTIQKNSNAQALNIRVPDELPDWNIPAKDMGYFLPNYLPAPENLTIQCRYCPNLLNLFANKFVFTNVMELNIFGAELDDNLLTALRHLLFVAEKVRKLRIDGFTRITQMKPFSDKFWSIRILELNLHFSRSKKADLFQENLSFDGICSIFPNIKSLASKSWMFTVYGIGQCRTLEEIDLSIIDPEKTNLESTKVFEELKQLKYLKLNLTFIRNCPDRVLEGLHSFKNDHLIYVNVHSNCNLSNNSENVFNYVFDKTQN